MKIVKRFKDNDSAYVSWCNDNNSGYVFNYFGGSDTRGDMNKIHRVNCSYLSRSKDEGKRTTTYEKVCSDSLEELKQFVTSVRSESWSYCGSKTCFPYAGRQRQTDI